MERLAKMAARKGTTRTGTRATPRSGSNLAIKHGLVRNKHQESLRRGLGLMHCAGYAPPMKRRQLTLWLSSVAEKDAGAVTTAGNPRLLLQQNRDSGKAELLTALLACHCRIRVPRCCDRLKPHVPPLASPHLCSLSLGPGSLSPDRRLHHWDTGQQMCSLSQTRVWPLPCIKYHQSAEGY